MIDRESALKKTGQGIARATRALELNGNPPAEFTFDPHWFTVTLRVRPADSMEPRTNANERES